MSLGLVFPGQGSQIVGMLSDFYEASALTRETFDEASEVLGCDLWKIVSTDERRLNQTEITQPAILTCSVAVFRELARQLNDSELLTTDNPVFCGHSLGEYSALVCSAKLGFSDAVKLVNLRGRAMQSAVPVGEGAMFAIIGLSDEQVISICKQAAEDCRQVVSAVNFNAPGQVVIAGEKAAVEHAGKACKDAGAKRALPLSVSVPSHCALMASAADQLASALSDVEFFENKTRVINNVDVACVYTADALKDALVRQLSMPVQWTRTIKRLTDYGVKEVIEIGPGKVLSGLVKRIDKSLAVTAMGELSTLQSWVEVRR